MFADGARADWLNVIAAQIMDGGDAPPSIDRLNIIVPPKILTRVSDGHVTAAKAFGEGRRKDKEAGWRVIISEMVTALREQGFVGGSDQGLTWIKPLDGEWKVNIPGAQITVFGQRERRLSRERNIVGERSEKDGLPVGPPSLFETGRGAPLELQVIGPRGGVTEQSFALHPFSLAIPPMTEAEREMLRSSIEQDGVKVPIVIYQKKILDGRNRSYFASVFKKPVRIEEFKGTEDEARRHVVILNIHRRHLNAVQLAILAEEFYGAKADQMAAEAHRQGSIRGNQSRSPAVLKSVQPALPKQAPKRHDIVADLAKKDGIKTTRYAVAGIQELMTGAPEALARAKAGGYHKTRDAVTAALKEKNRPLPTVMPEMTPRSVLERLGICIDNLNRILIDCEMSPGQKPDEISGRLNQIESLIPRVRQELRKRKMIS